MEHSEQVVIIMKLYQLLATPRLMLITMIAILNNYPVEQIEPFIKQLKEKINQVYISKGASIGINLDPIFEYE